MSGTLPNIALVQQRDNNDDVMAGCLLYIYQAGTITPVTAYKDSGLTTGQELPWPVLADATGRIPFFYLADGSYRARLASADGGFVAFDIPLLSTVGSSSDSGGTTTVTISAWSTGDVIWQPVQATRDGWVRGNGRTIGSASSGGTERANTDTQALYEWLWNNFADSICPVSGGRGASASADWTANKPIATLNFRDKTIVGLDDMGNTAASGLDASFADPTTAGSSGGANTIQLTIDKLPNLPVTSTISAEPTYNDATGTTASITQGGGASVTAFASPARTSSASGGAITSTIAGTSGTTNGGAHNNMQAGILGTFYLKL